VVCCDKVVISLHGNLKETVKVATQTIGQRGRISLTEFNVDIGGFQIQATQGWQAPRYHPVWLVLRFRRDTLESLRGAQDRWNIGNIGNNGRESKPLEKQKIAVSWRSDKRSRST
jgi:hypothetical protein